MTNEELDERRKNLHAKGELYAKGYCAAMHADALDMLDDARLLEDQHGDPGADAVRSYLLTRATELQRDAEKLRP